MPTVYTAEPLAKGSRVEVCCHDDAAGTPKWYQAIVMQFGKNDRDDKVRVQYAAPGEEPGEDARKVRSYFILCWSPAIRSSPSVCRRNGNRWRRCDLLLLQRPKAG